MDFEKIESKKLYVRVAEQIMDRIRDGRLKPGSKLDSDRDLAHHMGVSRTSVREALIALELLGVVKMRVGQGTFVTSARGALDTFDFAELTSPFDLLEARDAVESNVAKLVARKWREGMVVEAPYKRVYEINKEMRDLVATDGEEERFYRLGLDFHKALAEASGNEVLFAIVTNLVDASSHPLWALLNRKLMEGREAREAQIREHEAVIAAIERGDERSAAEAMCGHLDHLGSLAIEY